MPKQNKQLQRQNKRITHVLRHSGSGTATAIWSARLDWNLTSRGNFSRTHLRKPGTESERPSSPIRSIREFMAFFKWRPNPIESNGRGFWKGLCAQTWSWRDTIWEKSGAVNNCYGGRHGINNCEQVIERESIFLFYFLFRCFLWGLNLYGHKTAFVIREDWILSLIVVVVVIVNLWTWGNFFST